MRAALAHAFRRALGVLLTIIAFVVVATVLILREPDDCEYLDGDDDA